MDMLDPTCRLRAAFALAARLAAERAAANLAEHQNEAKPRVAIADAAAPAPAFDSAATEQQTRNTRDPSG